MRSIIEQLSREGNGAVQVDDSYEVPLKVFLAGPIKYWWGIDAEGRELWGSREHRVYTEWRDAVRVALVKTGFSVVYSPHRAIQGPWHEDLQRVNDAALMYSDVVVVLTPPGIPATGTDSEVAMAMRFRIPVAQAPPGDDKDLVALVILLRDAHRQVKERRSA